MELQSNLGRSYSNTIACDNARVHMGDVYNYADSDSKEKQVLDWLSPLNPSQSHNQACKQYQQGTLGWFFADPFFQLWRDAPESGRTLWCRGELGTGKTTLVAQVLTHLQEKDVSRGDIAVVYGRYSECDSQTAESLIGSILAQLLQRSPQGFDIPEYIQEALRSQSFFWQRKPTLQQLQVWFHRRLDVGGPVFVLLDAADEMKTSSRIALLRTLQPTHRNLKLLVASRNIPDIGAELLDNEEIEIRTHGDDVQIMTLVKLHEQSTERFRATILSKPGRSPCFATMGEEILFEVRNTG
jgi:hypothetical protein